MYAASTLDATRLRALLGEVAAGRQPVEEAERRLARLPFEDLGYARVDHHRAVRGLGPEVIYARGKTPEQVAGIAAAILAQGGAPVLATKADQDHAEAVDAFLSKRPPNFTGR